MILKIEEVTYELNKWKCFRGTYLIATIRKTDGTYMLEGLAYISTDEVFEINSFMQSLKEQHPALTPQTPE